METTREIQLKQIIKCFDFWMSIKEAQINLVHTFFENSSVKNIGVYGYGRLGRHLVKEIREADYHLAWIADRKADEIRKNLKKNDNLKIILPEEITDTCDYVIVTAAGSMDSTEKAISEKINTRVVQLEEVLIAALKRKEML